MKKRILSVLLAIALIAGSLPLMEERASATSTPSVEETLNTFDMFEDELPDQIMCYLDSNGDLQTPKNTMSFYTSFYDLESLNIDEDYFNSNISLKYKWYMYDESDAEFKIVEVDLPDMPGTAANYIGLDLSPSGHEYSIETASVGSGSVIKSITNWKTDVSLGSTGAEVSGYRSGMVWSGFALQDALGGIKACLMDGDTILVEAPDSEIIPIRANTLKRNTPLDLTSASPVYYRDINCANQEFVPSDDEITDSGEGWSWERDSGGKRVLTLSGLNIDIPASKSANFGIKIPNNTKIVIKDGTTNYIRIYNDGAILGGIYNEETTHDYNSIEITIIGKGTLNIDIDNGTEYQGECNGILIGGARRFSMKEATINVKSDATYKNDVVGFGFKMTQHQSEAIFRSGRFTYTNYSTESALATQRGAIRVWDKNSDSETSLRFGGTEITYNDSKSQGFCTANWMSGLYGIRGEGISDEAASKLSRTIYNTSDASQYVKDTLYKEGSGTLTARLYTGPALSASLFPGTSGLFRKVSDSEGEIIIGKNVSEQISCGLYYAPDFSSELIAEWFSDASCTAAMDCPEGLSLSNLHINVSDGWSYESGYAYVILQANPFTEFGTYYLRLSAMVGGEKVSASPLKISVIPFKRTEKLDLSSSSDVKVQIDDTDIPTADYVTFNPIRESYVATYEGWSWNHRTMTLTLMGADFDISADEEAIILDYGSTIIVEDGTENNIFISYTDDHESVIEGNAGLTFKGTGLLRLGYTEGCTTNASEGIGMDSCAIPGIDEFKLVFDGPTIEFYGAPSDNNFIPVKTTGFTIELRSGKLKTVREYNPSRPVFLSGDCTLKFMGGTIETLGEGGRSVFDGSTNTVIAYPGTVFENVSGHDNASAFTGTLLTEKSDKNMYISKNSYIGYVPGIVAGYEEDEAHNELVPSTIKGVAKDVKVNVTGYNIPSDFSGYTLGWYSNPTCTTAVTAPQGITVIPPASFDNGCGQYTISISEDAPVFYGFLKISYGEAKAVVTVEVCVLTRSSQLDLTKDKIKVAPAEILINPFAAFDEYPTNADIDAYTEGWKWDAAKKELTLCNLRLWIQSSSLSRLFGEGDVRAAIVLPEGATIVLEENSSNLIQVDMSTLGAVSGISFMGDQACKITGKGALSFSLESSANENVVAFEAPELSIEDGAKVVAMNKNNATGSSCELIGFRSTAGSSGKLTVSEKALVILNSEVYDKYGHIGKETGVFGANVLVDGAILAVMTDSKAYVSAVTNPGGSFEIRNGGMLLGYGVGSYTGVAVDVSDIVIHRGMLAVQGIEKLIPSGTTIKAMGPATVTAIADISTDALMSEGGFTASDDVDVNCASNLINVGYGIVYTPVPENQVKRIAPVTDALAGELGLTCGEATNYEVKGIFSYNGSSYTSATGTGITASVVKEGGKEKLKYSTTSSTPSGTWYIKVSAGLSEVDLNIALGSDPSQLWITTEKDIYVPIVVERPAPPIDPEPVVISNPSVPITIGSKDMKADAKFIGNKALISKLDTTENSFDNADTMIFKLSSMGRDLKSVGFSDETMKSVCDIVKNNEKLNSIQLILSNAALEVDGKALSTFAGKTAGEELTISAGEVDRSSLTKAQLEKLDKDNTVGAYELDITAGNKNISEFDGGKILFRYKADAAKLKNKDIRFLHTYCVGKDGSTELIRSWGEDKYYVSEHSHASLYIIVYDESFENDTKKDQKTAETDNGFDKLVTEAPMFNMNKTLYVGNTFKVDLTNVEKKAMVSFSSTNEKVAKVSDNGVITAKKAGKATIAVFVVQNGSIYKALINVTVKNGGWNYKGLTEEAIVNGTGELPMLNAYKVVNKGKSSTLSFTGIADDAKISYISEDEKIATVSSKGKIKGVAKGYTGILAVIKQNGFTYTYRIVVRVADGSGDEEAVKYLIK